MRFTDSHCHLTDDAFHGDRPGVLERARRAGVSRIVTVASDPSDAQVARKLAQTHDPVWYSAGIHPHVVGGSPSGGLSQVRDAADHPRCVAIGETGLDYHYDSAPRASQRRSFLDHAKLAADLELPLIVHSRNAVADTAAVIREVGGAGQVLGVLHCFTGPRDLLALALEAGWYVSFTGIVTFRGFDVELLDAVSSGRYMVETDSPYLAPVPRRGRRNEPAFLVHVAQAIARIRNQPLARVAADTWDNATRFFRFEKRRTPRRVGVFDGRRLDPSAGRGSEGAETAPRGGGRNGYPS